MDNEWATLRAENARLQTERDEALTGWAPLIQPKALAQEVFARALENEPNLDMRAVPNGWLMHERGVSQHMADRLDAARKALRELEQAEACYREMRDRWVWRTYSYECVKTAHAWDRMRRAGDEARRVLDKEE